MLLSTVICNAGDEKLYLDEQPWHYLAGNSYSWLET